MAKMNKAQLNVTVSEEAKQKADEYGASGRYSSASNFVESALQYYLGAIEQEELQALKEENEALKRAVEEYKKIKDEYDLQTASIFKLITKYPKLATELNELKKAEYNLSEYTRKVTFE